MAIDSSLRVRAVTGTHVIFVHGFGSKRLLMRPLQWRMRALGFSASRFGYFSLRGSLEVHAERLSRVLHASVEDFDKLHIVAHSMGSAVVRLGLTLGVPSNLGRIVLIAPPNKGSPVATIFGNALRLVCPAVGELSTVSASLVNQIRDDPGIEFGVIAGRYDWMVPTSKTRLSCQADHICLRATHNSLLFQSGVADQVASFLTTGHFAHPPKQQSAA